MKFRKRPCFWSALLFISGISGGYYLDQHLILIIVLFSLLFTVIILISKNKILTLVMIFMVLSGCLLIYMHQCRYNSCYSSLYWNEKGCCQVRGEIIENLSSLDSNRIYLRPDKINGRTVRYGLIQLNKDYLPAEFLDGQIVTIYLRLKTPEPARNPGGFSCKNHLKKKGIYSKGYYVKGSEPDYYTIHGRHLKFLKSNLLKLKKKLIYLADLSFKSPLNEVVKALVLGERNNLPSEWKNNFSRAGASHLLAISGLHVGFIMLIIIFALDSLKLHEIIKNILSTIFILIYIFITGIRASVFRAGILSLFFLWAPVWKRRGDLLNICGITAILNLLLNPHLLFTAGFQLSYLVLLSIIFWTDIIKENINKVIAVSAAAQLGSIPVAAYYFNMITPVGILTNIWAIPLIAVIVLIAIIGLLTGLINPVFTIVSGTIINFLIILVKKGISLMLFVPGGYLEVPEPPLFLMILFYIFIFSFPLIMKKNRLPFEKLKRRYGGILVSVITTAVLLFYIILPVFDNNLKITFLSVEQGDSILLRIPAEKNILIDSGDREGKNYVLSYLKNKGIKR